MPPKILLIDDAELDNVILKAFLYRVSSDYVIESCTNGQQAIDKLKELLLRDPSELPDYIFLDISMPVMDGWAFLKEFDQLSSALFKTSKIYVLTSSLNKRDREKCILYPHVKGYLSKPVDEHRLKSIMAIA